MVSGPAGAAIWSAPSIDRKRGLTYVVTGDSYTEVEEKMSDAISDMAGKTYFDFDAVWQRQAVSAATLEYALWTAERVMRVLTFEPPSR